MCKKQNRVVVTEVTFERRKSNMKTLQQQDINAVSGCSIVDGDGECLDAIDAEPDSAMYPINNHQHLPLPVPILRKPRYASVDSIEPNDTPSRRPRRWLRSDTGKANNGYD
jgi:hypothetical protein